MRFETLPVVIETGIGLMPYTDHGLASGPELQFDIGRIARVRQQFEPDKCASADLDEDQADKKDEKLRFCRMRVKPSFAESS